MKTDIPLKVLAAACAPDLLPLLGSAATEVVAVESVELPMASVALDTLLRLRDRLGREYLHLLEWQGYKDPTFLWRVLLYVAWLGQRLPERPIAVTLVYLTPEDDTGEAIEQTVEGPGGWGVGFHAVRLWEQDGDAAVGTGRPGLAVLSPLMRGATAALVERAAAVVLVQPATARQADLLTILGVFAAPLLAPERFVRLIGKERLMASELISYLFKDEFAALEEARAAEQVRLEQRYEAERAHLEQERAAERARLEQEREAERARLEHEREAERAHLEQTFLHALVRTVEDTVSARFPATPVGLLTPLTNLRDAEQLQTLHAALLRAPDQESVERLLREAVASRN